MDNEQEIIMVSHLPTFLTDELIIEFLSYYQPSKIVLGQGRHKGKATAYFDQHEKASFMFQSLNQRMLLGKKLSAKKVTEGKLSKYKYSYPPANENTIQNIAKELRNNPSFYVSVLHVMNKLKLIPPFAPANDTVCSKESGDDVLLSEDVDKSTEDEDQVPENGENRSVHKRTKLDEASYPNVHHESVIIDHKELFHKKPIQSLKIIMPSTLTDMRPISTNHLKQEKSEILCSSGAVQVPQPIKHHTLSLEEIRANKLTIDGTLKNQYSSLILFLFVLYIYIYILQTTYYCLKR
ncbi:RNA-binding region-containing protein 3-like [Schistocerca gregaria]|uniref:RNA-binding region-containing protein 3-like n=1 Tax=Schistocerca gregaria TaxID=7010 RepID=UPI00211E2DB6|nr:RNA-binding region-containing protein 3-like [Schistocerca gregaria]